MSKYYKEPERRILTTDEVHQTVIEMRDAGTMERVAEMGDQIEVHDGLLRDALAACERERDEVVGSARILGQMLQHQVCIGRNEYTRANAAEADLARVRGVLREVLRLDAGGIYFRPGALLTVGQAIYDADLRARAEAEVEGRRSRT